MWSAETRTNRGPSGAVLLTVELWSGWMLAAQSDHVTFCEGTNGIALSYTSY